MIELPRTLEEILIWRLEQVDTNIESYSHQLWCKDYALCGSMQAHEHVCSWLMDIVHLDGAVTHQQIQGSAYHYVFVAGIWIFTLNEREMFGIFGSTHVHD
jgi:hypothetical protein